MKPSAKDTPRCRFLANLLTFPSGTRGRVIYCGIVLAVAGLVAAFFAKPYLKNSYHLWSARRDSRQAAEFLAQGNPRRAALAARDALAHHPNEVEAMRIMAQSLEAAGAPEAALWREQLASLRLGDAENTLAQARAALKTGEATKAEQLLVLIGPAERANAAFQTLAAAIALEKNDTAAAEAHWAEAARLEPDEKRHRLSLASLRLTSKTPAVRQAALAALQEMRGSPGTSLEAVRLLLGDAVRRREAPLARDLADALGADQRATFADKLTRLATLRMIHDERATTYLLELRDAAVAVPKELSTLLFWMNANDLSLMVAEWVRRMPEEIVTRPPVCVAASEAYQRTGNWRKLEELTVSAKWGDWDFLRKAFLAHALEHLDAEQDAAKVWSEAAASVRGRTDASEHLAKFALQAKWSKRADEILWSLAAMPQAPRWALDLLWQNAYQRGDTAQLLKLSGTISKADPKGLAARNNYAFLSFLTRSSEGNPQTLVQALHREHPENALVTTTYALSLYQQGRTGEAVELMSALKPEDLRQPQIALYHAIFLFGAGQSEKAGDSLKLAEKWPMLPEEKSLLDRAKIGGLKKPRSLDQIHDPATVPQITR